MREREREWGVERERDGRGGLHICLVSRGGREGGGFAFFFYVVFFTCFLLEGILAGFALTKTATDKYRVSLCSANALYSVR